MELFKQTRILNFMRYSNYGVVVSAILALLALGLLFFKGFSLGIDFAGGSLVQVRYTQNAPIKEVRDLFEKEARFKGVQVSEFGSKEEILIKFPFVETAENEDLNAIVANILKPSGDFEIRKFDTVGPRVGSELKEKGILSLILALIAIMVYVSFRYEWRFALASVVALVHDVILVASSVIVFKIDMNLEVIAALLTLIGYSINDTIIIFDRIREEMLSQKTKNAIQAINEAISSTLTRTLLTSLTVFFVVLILCVFGSKIIIGFSLPMLIGTIVGTYSSIFIAPKVALLLGFDMDKYYENEARKIKKAQEKEKMRRLYEGGQV
ncbi:protein translocase subunit SecF [Helicobacter pylori]|uniref:protein translocase subunit SecF n=1 Tax=Helicobacter pylori TaxID=210 RepID=UPI001E443F3E|nr:protein translocase subunit SecF [Helicobacter pylori]UOR74866.1 protein translocase subunit SecF [Helicobacter pylori]WRD65789.1 protein translocase subunit SecF [Helicobacter pylori]